MEVQGFLWELMTSWVKLMAGESAKSYCAINLQRCPFVMSFLVSKNENGKQFTGVYHVLLNKLSMCYPKVILFFLILQFSSDLKMCFLYTVHENGISQLLYNHGWWVFVFVLFFSVLSLGGFP